MVKKKDDMPDWVTDEIQNAKFKKPVEMKKSGYILEFYYEDNKLDAQLYDSVEDGRHIITMDVEKSIKIDDLLKGVRPLLPPPYKKRGKGTALDI